MDPFTKAKTSKTSPSQSAINPFAKALAETEQGTSGSKPKNPNSLLSEALARTGGQLSNPADQSPQDLQDQQAEWQRQQQKEALKRRLHQEINPVDTHDIFSRQEERVKQELEKTRQELKALAQEIASWRMDVDIAASQAIVNPGRGGSYYVSFFQQLRNFI